MIFEILGLKEAPHGCVAKTCAENDVSEGYFERHMSNILDQSCIGVWIGQAHVGRHIE